LEALLSNFTRKIEVYDIRYTGFQVSEGVRAIFVNSIRNRNALAVFL